MGVNDLRLTLACGPYDRTQALRDGSVKPDGIRLTCLTLKPSETFWRMLQFQEFDVSELSLSNYATLVATGENPFVAIPVFPSRAFRHSFIFVNAHSGIEKPADLSGKRGGVPVYGMTAAVWARGMLLHEYGVQPSTIDWVQERIDRVERRPQADIRVTQAPPGQELGEMLDQGEIDFLVTSYNPPSFQRGSTNVRRLFPDYKAVEQDYYRRTKIYPIMHTVVIRRDVVAANPWVPVSLYQAFCSAKDQCYRLMLQTGSFNTSLAFFQSALDEERALFGPDWWPYGLEANRPALEAGLQYVHEQGLSTRPVSLDELFAPSTHRPIPPSERHHG